MSVFWQEFFTFLAVLAFGIAVIRIAYGALIDWLSDDPKPEPVPNEEKNAQFSALLDEWEEKLHADIQPRSIGE